MTIRTLEQSTTPRSEVYKALDSEREYQNARWCKTSADQAAGHNPHSVCEWLVYMRYYLEKGLEIATTSNDPEAEANALEFVRKVAALGVVAMEQHGAPQRKGYER